MRAHLTLVALLYALVVLLGFVHEVRSEGFGTWSSVRTFNNSNPIIAYVGSKKINSRYPLKLAYCDSIECAAPTIITISEKIHPPMSKLSLSLNQTQALVAYNLDLSFIFCQDLGRSASNHPNCNSHASTTIELLEKEGEKNSVSLEASFTTTNGLPIFVFVDPNNGNIVVTYCDDISCQLPEHSFPTVIIDERTGDSVFSSPIVSTSPTTGLPIISYVESHNNTEENKLVAVFCADAHCSNFTKKTIDSSVAPGGHAVAFLTTTIFDASAQVPAFAYASYSGSSEVLEFAVCTDSSCTHIQYSVVGGSLSVYAGSLSMTRAQNGFALITFVSTENQLWAITCSTIDCDSPVANNITLGVSPISTSVTLYQGVTPIITFHDPERDSLRMAVCNTQSCNDHEVFLVDINMLPYEETVAFATVMTFLVLLIVTLSIVLVIGVVVLLKFRSRRVVGKYNRVK